MMKKRSICLVALVLCALIAAQAISIVLPTLAAEAPVVTRDNKPSSVQYTPSEDGKTMTISYLLDGEEVSYTVPNSAQYLSGGYAGVDDLGRSLYDSNSDKAGVVLAEQERYVGLFYFLWMGMHPLSGTNDKGIARDIQKILDKTSTVGYGVENEMHWFAEPLYGYYMSNDTWVMRKHAELLTNAGVDFLYFDATNNFTYYENALKMMEILHELNEQGYDAPQVVFYTNTAAPTRISELYHKIYKATVNAYPDTWFCIDGKPVVIAPEAREGTDDETIAYNNTHAVTEETKLASTGNPGRKIMDFFTVKRAIWPNNSTQVSNLTGNYWPWMDFKWPARVYTNAEGKEGAISVSVAQHSGNARFSESVLQNYQYNRGRSFVSNGKTSNNIKYNWLDLQFNSALEAAHSAVRNDPSRSYQGLNLQEQFDYAIASDAKYILVTGWNEWIAANQSTAEDPKFVDTFSVEYSRDIEMMRGGYFDNYYMQLVYNIQRIKGTAPVIVQDGRKKINLKGSFDQWNDITVTYTDVMGDTADRNNKAYSQTGYITATNTSGRNDIVASKVISDSKNLYFYIETAENISAYDTGSSWMQVYINSDRDATTGWYGYDYIVNYRAEGDTVTTVAKYTGEDGAYGFTATEEKISYSVKNNKMMIAVPLAELGIENFHDIDVEFKIADSETIYDEMEDFYCDGDVAPLGRLNYIYRNYTTDYDRDDVTDVPETDPPETETETETVTETVTETTPETATETLPEPTPETPVETQIETEAEMDSEIESEIESEFESESEIEMDSEIESESEIEMDSEIESESEIEMDSEIESESESIVEIETETKMEIETDPIVETETKAPETETEPETDPIIEAETPKVETETKKETETEPVVETEVPEVETEATIESKVESEIESELEFEAESEEESESEVESEVESDDIAESEVDSETTAETTAETQIETVTETVVNTETEDNLTVETAAKTETEQGTADGDADGCASVVSVTLGVLPLAIVAAFALRKKKD